ncbi:hypothetical protein IFM89_015136 [Coptis chinensis]|uniref:Uncharacterized protein n=1 Tax=Coptis chinensis TaxID=261450 RepID=A0A835HYJ4_9MAGN|nr:hypothetical protein IFM89_015136 [Coptis chinensis]
MGCKIGTSPTVVGEELGVLPRMYSTFAALELNQFVGFLGMTATKRNQPQSKFDIIIYDGINNEETLRMIGMIVRVFLFLTNLTTLTFLIILRGPPSGLPA